MSAVEKAAEVLHEMSCADDECDGSDMGGYESEAEAVVAAVTPTIAAKAWDQGYTSGHSRAMRQMSDEPGVRPGTNPYQEAPHD